MESGEQQPEARRRVKVYQLTQDGQWNDNGTGYVSLDDREDGQGKVLVVKSEEDGSVLLASNISGDDIYQRQQDTLVVWIDPETCIDLALSFQEAAGCTEIWEQVCSIQGRSPVVEENAEVDMSGGSQEALYEGDYEPLELPAVEADNLDEIVGILTKVPDLMLRRERIAAMIASGDYVKSLLELFAKFEEEKNFAGLHQLYNIFKNLVLLNDSSVLDMLFSEEYVVLVMGVLEFDPGLPVYPNHREYLQNIVIFKEVVPFENEELVAKIHQTFHVTYVKDVVLPRVLDDATFATLNSLIFFNNVDIVSTIQKDDRFLKRFFEALEETNGCTLPEDRARRTDLVLFLQELCNLGKSLQVPPRSAFYTTLCEHGLLKIFETTIGDPVLKVRVAGTEILTCTLGHDSSIVRSFILGQEKEEYPLFHQIIHQVNHDRSAGIRDHLVEILRMLIDSENMAGTPEKDEFLNLFYQNMIQKLCEPLMVEDMVPEICPDPAGSIKEHVCGLLAFCVQHHGYRVKYFILGNAVAQKILKLMKHKETFLVLSALRFFRVFVGMKEEFYNRFIVTHNLLDPIVQRFKINRRHNNLVASATIELFNFIKTENIKNLVTHIAEKHMDDLRIGSGVHCEVFEELELKHQQNVEFELSGGVMARESSPTAETNKPRRGLDSREEAYFEGSDDDGDDGLPPMVLPAARSLPPLRASSDEDDSSAGSPFDFSSKDSSRSSPFEQRKPSRKHAHDSLGGEPDLEDSLVPAAKRQRVSIHTPKTLGHSSAKEEP